MMKKLLLLAFLVVGMTAYAETSVTNNDDEKDSKGGINLGKGANENDRLSMHLYIGFNVPTNVPDGMKFSPTRSLDFNITLLEYDFTPKNTKTTFSAGLGFNWRYYTLYGHKDAFSKVGDKLVVVPAGDYMEKLSSDVHTTSLSMPLLVKQKFSKHFAVSLGAQVNWNYYGRMENDYKHHDDKVEITTKNIGQRPITVDLMGIVNVWETGFYCKYSPMSVLKKDRGPEFKSLAFGLYF